jgi:DNA-binding NarL/FixJ family response regulator
MSISVVIADDQAMVRAGFGALLDAQPDIQVVGDAANGLEALQVVEATNPDVVLMDVRMPLMDGLEAARAILRNPAHPPDESEHPHVRVLMLTTFDLDDYVYDALRAGASGFLLKDARPNDLVEAVRIVAAGDALLAPSVTRRLIADFALRRSAVVSSARAQALTDREHDVLRLIAHGMSNAEIAADLVVAEQTVKTHVSRIFAKLGLRDRAQAVVFAYEHGLVVAGRDE